MSKLGPQNQKPPVSAVVPYATQLITPMDIDMPDVSPELAECLGDQWKSGFGQIQRAMGYSKSTTQETYKHYFDDLYIRKTRTGASISAGTGAAGAEFTLTIDTNDRYTVGSKQFLYLKKGQIVMFPTQLTGGVKYRAIVKDVTVATPSVTLQLLDSTQSLPALSSGINLIGFTYGAAEGSGQPDATLRNIQNRSGRLQKIKSTMRATGTEISQGKWFKKGTESGDMLFFYSYAMKQVEYEMQMYEDGALMWGDFTTNSVSNPLTDPFGLGTLVYTTEGLVTATEKRGNVLPYNIGSFDITDFNQSSVVSEGENSGNTQAVFASNNFLIEVEDVLVDYLKHTEIQYAFGESARYVAEIGFQGIRKADVLYMFKKLEVLSHPELYAAPGFEDLTNMAMVIPVKRAKGYWDAEKRDPAMLPTFGQRYKELGGYNRRSQAWQIDGSGFETPANRMVSEYDVNQLFQRSDIGGEYMCENQFQLWTGTY